MRHTFLVVTVKRWLKSVYIYGSYRKIKTGVPLFWTTLYMQINLNISFCCIMYNHYNVATSQILYIANSDDNKAIRYKAKARKAAGCKVKAKMLALKPRPTPNMPDC